MKANFDEDSELVLKVINLVCYSNISYLNCFLSTVTFNGKSRVLLLEILAVGPWPAYAEIVGLPQN